MEARALHIRLRIPLACQAVVGVSFVLALAKQECYSRMGTADIFPRYGHFDVPHGGLCVDAGLSTQICTGALLSKCGQI